MPRAVAQAGLWVLTLASLQGNSEAQNNLGYMYDLGLGAGESLLGFAGGVSGLRRSA
jgi:TPR repeat protein